MSRVRRKRHRERRAAEELDQEYQRRTDVWRAVVRHARPAWPDAQVPMRCMPSNAEQLGVLPRKSHPGNDGKIIFDSEEAARAASADAIALGGVPQRAYHCRRHRPGHDGHWHLTTDSDGARQANALVNQQFLLLRDRVRRYAS